MSSLKQNAQIVVDWSLSHKFNENMLPFLVGLIGLLFNTAHVKVLVDLRGEFGTTVGSRCYHLAFKTVFEVHLR